MSKDKPDHNEPTQESLFLHHAEFHPAQSNKTPHAPPPPQEILWRESPTSLTRDKAPAHRIPKAQRFCSTKIDLLKHKQLESMQQERDSFRKTGISFPRSTRPQHFPKHPIATQASPVSYHFARFMDNTNYKVKTERSLSNSSSKKKPDIKGGTMNNFFNYHKTYMPQANRLPYQPQCTIDNPSPCEYRLILSTRNKNIKYSFDSAFSRFKAAGSNSPGPAAYSSEPQSRSKSFNAKGTFPKSNRTYLRNFQSKPAPNHYKVARFLEEQ